MCAVQLRSTHLVRKEGFDLGGNGIKIPADVVGQEAGKRNEGVSDIGRREASRVARKDKGARRRLEGDACLRECVRVYLERQRGHRGMCQRSDECSEGKD